MAQAIRRFLLVKQGACVGSFSADREKWNGASGRAKLGAFDPTDLE
jgi:hypothetical protein